MSKGQNCFLFPLGSTETRAGLKTERVVTVRTVKGKKKRKSEAVGVCMPDSYKETNIPFSQ